MRKKLSFSLSVHLFIYLNTNSRIARYVQHLVYHIGKKFLDLGFWKNSDVCSFILSVHLRLPASQQFLKVYAMKRKMS